MFEPQTRADINSKGLLSSSKEQHVCSMCSINILNKDLFERSPKMEPGSFVIVSSPGRHSLWVRRRMRSQGQGQVTLSLISYKPLAASVKENVANQKTSRLPAWNIKVVQNVPSVSQGSQLHCLEINNGTLMMSQLDSVTFAARFQGNSIA